MRPNVKNAPVKGRGAERHSRTKSNMWRVWLRVPCWAGREEAQLPVTGWVRDIPWVGDSHLPIPVSMELEKAKSILSLFIFTLLIIAFLIHSYNSHATKFPLLYNQQFLV